MIRTFTLAVGLAISASAAQAAFVGFGVVEGDSAAATTAIGSPAITFQIFATFDGLGDGAVNTVLSTGFANMTLAGGTFFNNTVFGTDTPPSGALVNLPGFETLRYDTYGTIGALFSTDPGGAGVSADADPQHITPTQILGGWFNSSPPSNVGAAVANANLSTGFGTLLWNLTVTGANANASVANILSLISGSFSVFEQVPGGALEHVVTIVPTPGALALFGIAGLAATRRRR